MHLGIARLQYHTIAVNKAAQALDFERAAFLRDQLRELKELPEFVLVESSKKKSDHLAAQKYKRHKKDV